MCIYIWLFFCLTHFFGCPQPSTLLQMGCKPNKTTPIEPVYPESTNGSLFPWAQLRLPQSVHPLSYDLTLNPDLDNMIFSGCTVIDMLVLHNTKRIVLHSANLNITKATFKVGFTGGSVLTTVCNQCLVLFYFRQLCFILWCAKPVFYLRLSSSWVMVTPVMWLYWSTNLRSR